jgi:hypothetical protein
MRFLKYFFNIEMEQQIGNTWAIYRIQNVIPRVKFYCVRARIQPQLTRPKNRRREHSFRVISQF